MCGNNFAKARPVSAYDWLNHNVTEQARQETKYEGLSNKKSL